MGGSTFLPCPTEILLRRVPPRCGVTHRDHARDDVGTMRRERGKGAQSGMAHRRDGESKEKNRARRGDVEKATREERQARKRERVRGREREEKRWKGSKANRGCGGMCARVRCFLSPLSLSLAAPSLLSPSFALAGVRLIVHGRLHAHVRTCSCLCGGLLRQKRYRLRCGLFLLSPLSLPPSLVSVSRPSSFFPASSLSFFTGTFRGMRGGTF